MPIGQLQVGSGTGSPLFQAWPMGPLDLAGGQLPSWASLLRWPTQAPVLRAGPLPTGLSPISAPRSFPRLSLPGADPGLAGSVPRPAHGLTAPFSVQPWTPAAPLSFGDPGGPSTNRITTLNPDPLASAVPAAGIAATLAAQGIQALRAPPTIPPYDPYGLDPSVLGGGTTGFNDPNVGTLVGLGMLGQGISTGNEADIAQGGLYTAASFIPGAGPLFAAAKLFELLFAGPGGGLFGGDDPRTLSGEERHLMEVQASQMDFAARVKSANTLDDIAAALTAVSGTPTGAADLTPDKVVTLLGQSPMLDVSLGGSAGNIARINFLDAMARASALPPAGLPTPSSATTGGEYTPEMLALFEGVRQGRVTPPAGMSPDEYIQQLASRQVALPGRTLAPVGEPPAFEGIRRGLITPPPGSSPDEYIQAIASGRLPMPTGPLTTPADRAALIRSLSPELQALHPDVIDATAQGLSLEESLGTRTIRHVEGIHPESLFALFGPGTYSTPGGVVIVTGSGEVVLANPWAELMNWQAGL